MTPEIAFLFLIGILFCLAAVIVEILYAPWDHRHDR